MSLPPKTRQELCELLSALRDGQIDSAGVERLDYLVARDSSARRLYLDYVNLCASLHWTRNNHGSVSPSFTHLQATDSQCDSGWEDSRAATPVSDQQDGVAPSAPLGTSTPSHSFSRPTPDLPPLGTFSHFSSGWPLAYLIATVIFGVGLLVGAFTHVSPPGQIATESSMPAASIAQQAAGSVGRITGMVDCQWTEDATVAINGARVPLSRKYALASGLMEITYDSGARVILQGPVAYEATSTNGGFLSAGKLTGKMENETAKGFVVRTPTAIVTDLGTEFGVEVGSNGAMDAQVFAGRVEIVTLAGKGGGKGQSQIIRTGQSAHVGAESTLVTSERDFEARSSRFARTMPDAPNSGDSYGRLVLSMNPVVYYRMDAWSTTDRNNCFVLADSASGGHHGMVFADAAFGQPGCRGKFGGALVRHGSMGDDYAFVGNYPKPTNGELSVSVWVWPRIMDGTANIVSNWCDTPSGGDVGSFALGIDGALALTANIRQTDGRRATVHETGKSLVGSVWHHVAMVADGAVLHLYHNGEEVGTTPYHGIASKPVRDCLSIGCGIDDSGTRPRLENAFPWNGRLDELAVFNHALIAEQVRQLYKAQATAIGGRTSP